MNANETAVLGGGCFWCLEAAYELVTGVKEVLCGYAGGQTENPSYEEVASGATGHAEVVRITFDPKKISYKELLDIFWVIHNPTTINQQDYDIGPEYRSIILYANDKQKRAAEASKKRAQEVWEEPIVTEIQSLKAFYEAEPIQQHYFREHPEQAYCRIIINPKLEKLRGRFAKHLKK